MILLFVLRDRFVSNGEKKEILPMTDVTIKPVTDVTVIKNVWNSKAPKIFQPETAIKKETCAVISDSFYTSRMILLDKSSKVLGIK